MAAVLAIAAYASADTLTGTVTNATTGKPSAGDDVVLLALSQGMTEVGRTKTDPQGKFKLDLNDTGTPHMVRVNHQGVNYFPEAGPIRPGVTTVDIKVYDAAQKLDGVTASVQVMRLQSDGSSLQILELMAVKNSSNPPRALMNDRTFEFYLPDGAQIDQSIAQSPGGMPVNTAPVPEDQKGKYYFVFPLRPGETRFEVAYHLPYSGEATLQPKLLGNLEHFVVFMPKSMQFAAKVEGTFSPMADDNGQSNIQVATGVKPGQDLSFRVAGTGMLPDESGSGGQPSAQAGAAPDNRPGGGLGTPEGTPDPLHKYRWAILGGCAALLALGAFFIVNRAGGAQLATAPAVAPISPAAATGGQPTLLLQALKEELFQLEVERQQGRVSSEEYQQAKSALDQTLQRALARVAQPPR